MCPRCRSGAVGSSPSFTRSGVPWARERSSLARSSLSTMTSAAPRLRTRELLVDGAKAGASHSIGVVPWRSEPRKIGPPLVASVYNGGPWQQGSGAEPRGAAFKRRRPWLRGLLIGVGLLTLFVITLLGVGALWALTILPRSLPSVTALEKLEPLKGTKIYDENDELLTELHVERRIFVPLSQVPRQLHDAVIATEDRRFYYHWGVDPIGIGRAVLQNYRRGRIVEGGSTITQQLAKVLFLTPDKSLERKLKEAVLALEIERRYAKDRILEMYLNQVYFGQGAYGVEAAVPNVLWKVGVGGDRAGGRPARRTAPGTVHLCPVRAPQGAPSSAARSCCARWSSTAPSRTRTPASSPSPISG